MASGRARQRPVLLAAIGRDRAAASESDSRCPATSDAALDGLRLWLPLPRPSCWRRGRVRRVRAGCTIVGTEGDDVIRGLGGNDTIDGLEGNDIIRGGMGADTIRGGKGADIRVRGGPRLATPAYEAVTK
ncbi:MAG: hypothetical protein OXG37_00945 [Actinomycetia bacterium]|nr:hypothetical protein [Actinomycetes bacterium]